MKSQNAVAETNADGGAELSPRKTASRLELRGVNAEASASGGPFLAWHHFSVNKNLQSHTTNDFKVLA